MKLVRPATAQRLFFGEGEIDVRSIIAAVERGDIPGQIWRSGGKIQCWIDAEAFALKLGSKLADLVQQDLQRSESPERGRKPTRPRRRPAQAAT